MTVRNVDAAGGAAGPQAVQLRAVSCRGLKSYLSRASTSCAPTKTNNPRMTTSSRFVVQ
jgi:hypothetical protein